MQDLLMKLMQMSQAAQAQQPKAGQATALSDLMIGAAPQTIQGMAVSPEEYAAIMQKVQKGQPRTDMETQKLQQYMMQKQTREGVGGVATNRNVNPITPTHRQPGQSSLPRAIFDPFGTLSDAMKGQ